jgi:hypothetical protein
MRFLHRRIKAIGSPDTHRFAAYLLRLRRKISRQYGGTNWGDNQRVDTKYNWTPKRRAEKRNERREALQQAYSDLREAYQDSVVSRVLKLQGERWDNYFDPEDDELFLISQFEEYLHGD